MFTRELSFADSLEQTHEKVQLLSHDSMPYHAWHEYSMTIRKTNFGTFPELSPLFQFSLDNRRRTRTCQGGCKTRPLVLYLQDAPTDATRYPPAFCWDCASKTIATLARLAPDTEPVL